MKFHHLSLHTQAHKEGFKQHSVTAFAGRPVAMRESRTLSSLKDSGIKLAQNPPNLSRTDARKHESCKEVMSSVEYNQNIPTYRKCRRELARLTRKLHRINRRRYQRQLFRKIRSQALCLASQLPAYLAQEPTNPAHGNLSPSTVDLHTRSVAHTHSEDLSCSSELSDYQDAVLLNKYPTSLLIATLNCRGLSSLSKRERVIYLMHKNKIDVLCLQETKINSNSREEHDGFIMFWSSGIEDDCRNKAEELKRSGKGCRNNAAHARIFRSAIEHLGVGIVYRKSLQSYVVDVKQHSARNIMLTFSMPAGRLDIISTYAPQACHEDPSASDAHYAELDTLLDDHYAFSPRLILGDFNARNIKALPSESEVVGPYTLGASLADLDCLSHAQQDNRSRFIEFCLARNMVVKNTFFQKSDEQLVTYKSVGVKSWHPPWQLDKYAQMDFVLINQKWKNAVENIYTTAVHTVDTDHKLMIAEVKFKLIAKTMNSPVSHIKYRTPSPQELIAYNHAVSTRLTHISADASAEGLTSTSFSQILSDSAKAALTRLPPKQKKPYISATTWQLLESKWSALESNNTELADVLTGQIKDQVRKDKEDHLLSQLEEITSQGYKWDGLKRLRAKFTPSFTRFKDSSRNHVPHTDCPHKAADYLQHTRSGSTPASNTCRKRR